MAIDYQFLRVSQVFLAALALALMVGCSEQPNTVVTTPAEPPTATAEAPGEEKGDEPAPKATDESPEQETVQQAVWAPPFPNRTDLFQPPRYSGRVARSGDERSDSVVLMGFADLGTPVALLEIDGEVTPLAEQGETAGVEVISITPPRVVLQRGRTRWTASVE